MESQKPNTQLNYYFTKDTEDAIVSYNNSSDPLFRDKIFRERIYYPFYKLAENIIHSFKFYYTDVEDVEDLKLEIISVLVEEKIHRFDPTNGAKAFSYFQTIVKRWLINYNGKNYKKRTQTASFDELVDSGEDENHTLGEHEITLGGIIDMFVEQCYVKLPELFTKEMDQKVADAILTIFKVRADLNIFKKKALYIYIREITDCTTPTVTRVIGILKEEFYNLYFKIQKAGYEIK